jgi:hypothetical protein
MIRLSLTYPVTSNIRLSAPEKIRDGENLIEFTPDENGRIGAVKITVPAVPRKSPVDPDIPIGRQMPDIMRPLVDRSASQEIERYALSIETLADAFLGHFVLNWPLYRMEWTADTEEEMRSIRGPCSIKASYAGSTDKDVQANPAVLRQIVSDKTRFDDLVVPLVFFNQGFREISEHRLIAAYYSFFFVLEILFAPGYSSPSRVKNSFLRSSELKEAVETIRKAYTADILSSVILKRLLETAQCEMTTEGMIDFFIKVRGRLHHANWPSSPHHWLPVHAERFTHEVDLIAKVARQLINAKVQKRGMTR